MLKFKLFLQIFQIIPLLQIFIIFSRVSIANNVQRNSHIEKYVYKFVHSFGNLKLERK